MKDNCSFQDVDPDRMKGNVMNSKKLGRYNELRVMHAIETLKPWWCLECCWASDYEDRCGIDLWVRHNIMGWVPFQVKSSKTGFRNHVRQGNRHERDGGSKIPCVISNHEKTLDDIMVQLNEGLRFERLHGFFKKKIKALRKAQTLTRR